MLFNQLHNPILPIVSIMMCIILSCGVSKELKEERNMWGFQHWEQRFRERAYCRCLLEGLRNKGLRDSLIKYDKSFYDPLGFAIFDDAIDILLKTEIEKMVTDSVNSIGKYSLDLKSRMEGKKVTLHCLEFYKSDRLNSAAKSERKKWKKIPNILDEVHKKIPTY